jgi:hypothetical protein
MTKDELEYILTICHEWLQQLGIYNGSGLSLLAGRGLSRPVELEVRSLLTFDNVRVTVALDVETHACYTQLIEPPNQPGQFIDISPETLAAFPDPVPEKTTAPLTSTRRRYQEAMQHLAETQKKDAEEVPSLNTQNEWWIEKQASPAEPQPKYLLYTKGKLLGYSMLERHGSGGERRGRFHPDENYFEYSQIFAALPQAENDWMEANAQEAYGIFAADNNGYRTRFALLSAQVDELELYVEDESGARIEAAELRLEDLSHHYGDETERWLYVTINQKLSE